MALKVEERRKRVEYVKIVVPAKVWFITYYRRFLGEKEIEHGRYEVGEPFYPVAVHVSKWSCGCEFTYKVGVVDAVTYWLGVRLIDKKLCEKHRSLKIDEEGNVETGRELCFSVPKTFLGYKVRSPSVKYTIEEDGSVTIEEVSFTVLWRKRFPSRVEEKVQIIIERNGHVGIGNWMETEAQTSILEKIMRRRDEVQEFIRSIRVELL